MKLIRYDVSTKSNCGTVENPEYVEILCRVEIPWTAENEAAAKAEAYMGRYTVTEFGEDNVLF